jgi:DNA-binding transcriptional MerR regulator
MSENAPDERLYKIGEVCRLADVQPYVLRYWETEFPPLTPNKSGGGQRLYTRREIDVILRIKQLLYSEGFTIAGAKKKLDLELTEAAAPKPKVAATPKRSTRAPKNNARRAKAIAGIRNELAAILRMLDERKN